MVCRRNISVDTPHKGDTEDDDDDDNDNNNNNYYYYNYNYLYTDAVTNKGGTQKPRTNSKYNQYQLT
jgi:hypothetical protein